MASGAGPAVLALLLLSAGCQRAPDTTPAGSAEAEQLASALADLESAEAEVADLQAQVLTLEQQLADARLAIELADVSGHDPRLEAAIARAEAAERDAAATRARERQVRDAAGRLVADVEAAAATVQRAPRAPARGWRALKLIEGGCQAADRGFDRWNWECQVRVSNSGETPAGFWATFFFMDRQGNVIERKLHHFTATAGLEAIYSTAVTVSGPDSDMVEKIQVKIGPGDP